MKLNKQCYTCAVKVEIFVFGHTWKVEYGFWNMTSVHEVLIS